MAESQTLAPPAEPVTDIEAAILIVRRIRAELIEVVQGWEDRNACADAKCE